MAALDLQEQEQVDALKAWWKDNAKWVMLALSVAVGGFTAMQGWKMYQGKQAAEAGALYTEVVKQLSSNDAKRVSDAASALTEKYASAAYAPRAQLLAAQANMDAGNLPQAKTELQWVIDHAAEEGLQHVARLKLGAVLLDEKNYAEAGKLAEAKHPESFDALYADLKGDVLSAQGKVGEARSAYKIALDKSDSKAMYRNLIQMKLDALGDGQ